MTTTTLTTDPPVVRYEAGLMDGTVFARIAASFGQFPGRYDPMLSARDYGAILAELGALAAENDRMAALVADALPRLNRYGTAYDAVRSTALAFARTIAEPFDDVAARTGPGACRYSAAQRAWTLADRIKADAALTRIDCTRSSVRGYGWCLVALAEREGVRLPEVAR